ncbi:peptidase U32 family protein [Agathobaculum sp.]|uniref:peptidase U32 family protein n=1 Tax=Agathobaculum sp. TaxID=2048138 RepID=UPI002A804653|nr:U32 family peptidase [Agathobaculum sp.]MDY3618886.1 U32 family peptidase [Agathobaculum sp.]
MAMGNNRPELLAPAGDLEKLRFAAAYGADAVYLAGEQFGMRAAASNFSEAELREGIAYAHMRNVRCYVTVNVMPSNRELAALPGYLELLQDVGADALIVADVGVLRLARKFAPRVPLHISTQTSILNYEAANFWADLGAERIVLARELSLEEIAEIRAKTPSALEIEAFVHGAMCISYSGRCLISQYLTGRDANRGACAQPCRWKYTLMEEKRPGEHFPVLEDDGGTYLYNSKDLCMIEHIPELVRAGITSFKIEGRNKTAYYAAGITGAYRRAIDAYLSEPDGFVLPADIREEIGKVSHRNYYTGFYFGTEEIGQHYEDSQYIRDWEVVGMPVGTRDDGAAMFSLKNRFYQGEELELMQPGCAPYVFAAEHAVNEEGEELGLFNRPEMRFALQFPFEVHPYGILRKRKERK